MPCSTAILLSQIVLFYDLIRIIISDDDQTVSNIINLDNHQFSNFYRWMEQNSHICKSEFILIFKVVLMRLIFLSKLC